MNCFQVTYLEIIYLMLKQKKSDYNSFNRVKILLENGNMMKFKN